MPKIILKENIKVQSILFSNKISDDSIFSFDEEEFFPFQTQDTIENVFTNHYNCNPDGWLLYIDKKFQEESINILKNSYKNGLENNKLNFTNGSFSESIVFYKVDTGLIVELLDPECFSEFFEDLVDELSEYLSDKIQYKYDFIQIPFAHIQSNFLTMKESDEGKAFLKKLNQNNVLY